MVTRLFDLNNKFHKLFLITLFGKITLTDKHLNLLKVMIPMFGNWSYFFKLFETDDKKNNSQYTMFQDLSLCTKVHLVKLILIGSE